MRVLVIAPHPDDDVLGCGGSIKKHVLAGNEIRVVYLTCGEAGGLPPLTPKGIASIRKREAEEALKVLSEKIQISFLNGKDGGLIRYGEELLFSLTEEIRKFKPQWIYLPHSKESHRDHQEAYYLGMEAVTRAGASCFPDLSIPPWYGVEVVLLYEVWTPLEEFNFVEDITFVVEDKKSAIEQHKSQLKYQNFGEGILALNRYRGVMSGKGKWVEVFKIKRFFKSA